VIVAVAHHVCSNHSYESSFLHSVAESFRHTLSQYDRALIFYHDCIIYKTQIVIAICCYVCQLAYAAKEFKQVEKVNRFLIKTTF
jgi:hypothetical protein